MNTKDKNYKKYLKTQRRIREIREAKKALGYEKLDKPYQKGFNMKWGLRDDILRREDADVLIYIVEKYGTSIYSRTGEFKHWSRTHRAYIDERPRFKLIPESEYDTYVSKVQKWFKYDPAEDKYSFWYGGVKRFYRVDIPDYFLVEKVEKNWVTHYKVHDEVLEQELSEQYDLSDRLIDYRRWYRMGHKTAKYYKTSKNRKLRRKLRMEISKRVNEDTLEEIESIRIRKNILWEMW